MDNGDIVHLGIYGQAAFDAVKIGFLHRYHNLYVCADQTEYKVQSMYKNRWLDGSIILAVDDEVCYVPAGAGVSGTIKSYFRSSLKDLLKYLKMCYNEDACLKFNCLSDTFNASTTIKQLEHIFGLLKKPTYEGKVDDPFLIFKRQLLIKDFLTFSCFDNVSGNVPPEISYVWSQLIVFKFKAMISQNTPEMMKGMFITYMKSIIDKYEKDEELKKDCYNMIMKISSCPEFDAFIKAVFEFRDMKFNVIELFNNRNAYLLMLKEML